MFLLYTLILVCFRLSTQNVYKQKLEFVLNKKV